MQDDPDLVDRLNALADRLPAALVGFAESLARQRDRAEGEGEPFRLTETQREEVGGILSALAQGREGSDIPAEVPATDRIAELAERVRELRERKKAAEEELAAATDELVREVGVGATVGTSRFRVRIGEPRLSVKIKDAGLLPSELLTLQPDRRAILDHVRDSAEVPPGAEISETRPTVYFSARGE